MVYCLKQQHPVRYFPFLCPCTWSVIFIVCFLTCYYPESDFSAVCDITFLSLQANVVCVVYDVTNEDTIDKVVTCCLVYIYIVSYWTSIPHIWQTALMSYFSDQNEMDTFSKRRCRKRKQVRIICWWVCATRVLLCRWTLLYFPLFAR